MKKQFVLSFHGLPVRESFLIPQRLVSTPTVPCGRLLGCARCLDVGSLPTSPPPRLASLHNLPRQCDVYSGQAWPPQIPQVRANPLGGATSLDLPWGAASQILQATQAPPLLQASKV
jgi:hypothetical protein